MANATDILLDANFDLPIFTGFFLGDSDKQHKRDRYISFPGFWKQYPDIGIGIRAYVKGRFNSNALRNKIITEAKKDGYNVEKVTITQGATLTIDEISYRP